MGDVTHRVWLHKGHTMYHRDMTKDDIADIAAGLSEVDADIHKQSNLYILSTFICNLVEEGVVFWVDCDAFPIVVEQRRKGKNSGSYHLNTATIDGFWIEEMTREDDPE